MHDGATEPDYGLCQLGSVIGQPQHDEPSAWMGGHLFVPYEQNTQQSPALGRNTVLQFSHS